jgi:hypothetical protein
MEEFFALARRMGLVRDEEHDCSLYGYGLAIGGLYVTLSDLAAAYGTPANDGREFRLHLLAGESGEAPYPRIFSSCAAREVTHFLCDDTARLPSFLRMSVLEFPFPGRRPGGARCPGVGYPKSGARYILDPGIPTRFQTMPLKASVLLRVRLIA